MQKFKFIDIYISNDGIIFNDKNNNKYLVVSNFDVTIINKNLSISNDIWHHFDYANNKKEEYHYIVEIAQDFDIFYFLLENGDIFQWYYLCHDESFPRVLNIFGESAKKIATPLGLNAYEAALDRISSAEQLIPTETN